MSEPEYRRSALLYKDRIVPEKPSNINGFFRDWQINYDALFQLFDRTVPDKTEVVEPLVITLGLSQRTRHPLSDGYATFDRKRGIIVGVTLSVRPQLSVCYPDIISGYLQDHTGAKYTGDDLENNFTLFHEWRHVVGSVEHAASLPNCERSCILLKCPVLRDEDGKLSRRCVRYWADEEECEEFAAAETKRVIQGLSQPIYLLSPEELKRHEQLRSLRLPEANRV